jgi:hypothetical protein
MPGDFTIYDFLAGYQEAGQAFLAVAEIVAAIGVVGVVCLGVFTWALAVAAGRADQALEMADIRAMAHERLAQHSALPYTDDEADSDWPKRKAS